MTILTNRWYKLKYVHHTLLKENISELFIALENEYWKYWEAIKVGKFLFINISNKGDGKRTVAMFAIEDFSRLRHVKTFVVAEENYNHVGGIIWDSETKRDGMIKTDLGWYQMIESFASFDGIDEEGFELTAIEMEKQEQERRD